MARRVEVVGGAKLLGGAAAVLGATVLASTVAMSAWSETGGRSCWRVAEHEGAGGAPEAREGSEDSSFAPWAGRMESDGDEELGTSLSGLLAAADETRAAAPRAPSRPAGSVGPGGAIAVPSGAGGGGSLGLSRRWPGGRTGSSPDPEGEEEPEPEYDSIRHYLADADESPAEVRDVVEVLADPSNVVAADGHVSLLAWDPHQGEPSGSYLYVLQQDGESKISQVHRFFCPERRLDVLAETCVPVASVYSDGGVPVAVGYSDQGQPVETRANLDPSHFSGGRGYVEANELLLFLQEYFDSMRA